jgi:translation initiation factor 3 subunit M
LIAAAKTEELIAKFLAQRAAIFGVESEQDVEGCVEGIVSVLFTLREGVDSVPIVKQILSALAEDTTMRTKLRLRAMVSLFNLAASGQSKYDVLIAIFRYAMATGQVNAVVRFHERVEEWVVAWGTAQLEQRALYQVVSEVLSKDGQQSLTLRFLIRFFGTFGGEEYPPDVQALATTAVVSAVKSPVPSFGDRNALLESFSKRQPAGALGSLVDLLRIICTGTVDSYKTYEAANKGIFATHGIDASEVEHNIRLLTLCSLGARQPTLTYADVASALQVDVGDVEMWVVEAISLGLLDASMDQFGAVVTVNRYAHRSFGPEQWSTLQQRLRALRATVAGVLESSKKYTS